MADSIVNHFSASLLTLHAAIKQFTLTRPFHITRHCVLDKDVVTVALEEGGPIGQGASSGVYYRTYEDAAGVLRQIEARFYACTHRRPCSSRSSGRADALKKL